jgi:photosystem II stability/assembly factor-like uncharacterized protein
VPVSLVGLSCPSQNACVTVGVDASGASVIYVTTVGGASWTSETVPVNTPDLRQVTCATSSECIAGGEVGDSQTYPVFTGTTDGGALWTTQPVDLSLLDSFGTVACGAPPNCYLLTNQGVARSTNQGINWSLMPGGRWQSTLTASPNDVTCVRGTTFCAIVGTNSSGAFEFRETRDGGSRIVQVAELKHVADNGAFLASCGSPRSCVVVSRLGARVLSTTNSGAKWAIRSLPKEVTEVESISCPTPSECVALVLGRRHLGTLLAATTRDGGASWSLSGISPDPKRSIADINCPSASRCYVAGPATPHGSVFVRYAINGSWHRTNV